MDLPDFFRGERIINRYIRYFYGGKAELSCTIVERWDVEIAQPLSCGAEYEHEFKHSVGMKSGERKQLESIVTGTLGLKNIANFKAEIKETIGVETSFEEFHEETKSFKISSPECGTFVLQIYQLVRSYKFSYRDYRFFHRNEWNCTLTERTSYFHDESKKTANDPRCGCSPNPDTGIDGLVYLLTRNVSVLQGYKKHTDRVEFPNMNISIDEEDISLIMFREYSINQVQLPSYLIFLAGIENDELPVTFIPYSEEGFVRQNERIKISDPSLRQRLFSIKNWEDFLSVQLEREKVERERGHRMRRKLE